MKYFIPAMLAIGATASPASAAYVFQVSQVGANVVMTGSGSLNLGGLTQSGTTSTTAGIQGTSGLAVVGTNIANAVLYGGFTGPASFGPGGFFTTASSPTGPTVGINVGANVIFVSPSYVSGSQFGVSTATFNNATFASLGLTAGTYVYSFGRVNTADTLTVQIGSGVPEPATWAMLIAGFGMIGGAMRRRKVTVSYA